MKILCFIDSLGSGGAQRQMVELAIGFKERGHQVEVLIYHPIFFFRDGLDENNIKVNVIQEKAFIPRVLKIRRFIRIYSPNAVLSFLQGPNLIAELSGFPCKKWRLIVGERSANPNILKKPFSKVLRWLHLLANGVVSNSNRNIEIVRKVNPFLSKDKCHVVYNVIDLDEWKNNIQGNEVNSSSRFIIAVAASVVSHKNTLGLVKAINGLPSQMKAQVQIHWFGKILNEAYYLEVVNYINSNDLTDCFKFKGESRNIRQEYQNSDAIGLFSKYEGLPNAVCEGMAMSKVVIASDISDVSLLLGKENGQLLFDPNKTEEISKAIIGLLNLSGPNLIRIGKRNREEALQLFNRDKIVGKYLNILK